MAEIQVQRAGVSGKKITNRELYAMVCYYYPRYSLKEAQDLPARDLNLLLKTARKIEAAYKHDMLLITAAPHGKDKNGVKKLAEQFLKAAKD